MKKYKQVRLYASTCEKVKRLGVFGDSYPVLFERIVDEQINRLDAKTISRTVREGK